MYEIAIELDVKQAIDRYALQHPTEEVCGLLEGSFVIDTKERIRAIAFAFHPITNIAKDLGYKSNADYVIGDYKQTLAVKTQILSNKRHIVGWVHTHPYWSCGPSSIDRSKAKQNDEFFWLIRSGINHDISCHYYNGKELTPGRLTVIDVKVNI